MPYDEALAERVQALIGKHRGVTEKRMFGGLAFMLDGNMCCGVMQGRIMMRLGPEGAEAALKEPHTAPMDFTGKPIKSMVYVRPEGYVSDADLEKWVKAAVGFAKSLPPK
ncbi:MAG: TfoX/Sxy family protein [Acidobacteria bacterium]|nr:TfoX/Sxy family protein [Acidobacteriota bacterium]